MLFVLGSHRLVSSFIFCDDSTNQMIWSKSLDIPFITKLYYPYTSTKCDLMPRCFITLHRNTGDYVHLKLALF